MINEVSSNIGYTANGNPHTRTSIKKAAIAVDSSVISIAGCAACLQRQVYKPSGLKGNLIENIKTFVNMKPALRDIIGNAVRDAE